VSRLTTYKKKRNAKATPEPQGRTAPDTKELIFVVQKHQASHLHYDFRLELDGVLKSWAVPKGPPLHSDEKHLAVMVEDHPYDYKDFAGVIPKGNYGAGVVNIWDSGTYSVAGALDVKDTQKAMRAGLKKGHIAVILHGKKLRGEYVLVRIAQDGKNNWLIFSKAARESPKREKADKRPKPITPMLASLVEQPFNKKGWLFELKLDGFRAIADVDKKQVKLLSRNQKSLSKEFPAVAKELEDLQKFAPILDGEIVALDEQGRSRFQLLQNYRRTQEGDVYYYVFDLLYCDGVNWCDRPLIERKERLELLLAHLKHSHIRYGDHIDEKGIGLFKEAKKHELEGIIAKKAQSTYQMKRSQDWLKIKTRIELTVFIGGFTQGRSAGTAFGSLMVGTLKGKELIYVGQVGTGFSDAVAKKLLTQLKARVTKTSPFKSHPKLEMAVTYVKPQIICHVSFAEWTDQGLMRHPVFEGLDENADEPR
jgi:bifunctional non-homologous end joining protein LigD